MIVVLMFSEPIVLGSTYSPMEPENCGNHSSTRGMHNTVNIDSKVPQPGPLPSLTVNSYDEDFAYPMGPPNGGSLNRPPCEAPSAANYETTPLGPPSNGFGHPSLENYYYDQGQFHYSKDDQEYYMNAHHLNGAYYNNNYNYNEGNQEYGEYCYDYSNGYNFCQDSNPHPICDSPPSNSSASLANHSHPNFATTAGTFH